MKAKLILPIFIISIMVLSVVGFSIGGKEDVVKYNGHKFTQTNEGWISYYGDRKVVLFNNPNELDVEVPFVGFQGVQKIYLSTKPGVRVQDISSFYFNILRYYKIVEACYEDVEGCENLPLKDCDDIDLGVGIVVVKGGNESKVTFDNNCLVFEGNDLRKHSDKLSLEMLE